MNYWAFLKAIPADVIRDTATKNESHEFFLEAVWQVWLHDDRSNSSKSEFYRIGYSLLTRDSYISAEVGVKGNNSNGRMDFIIKNGHRKWVVELASLGDYQWAVVDFHHGCPANKSLWSLMLTIFLKFTIVKLRKLLLCAYFGKAQRRSLERYYINH
jgi:hypothetical protein